MRTHEETKSAQTAPAPAVSEPATAPVAPLQVLTLQRTAGNAAVNRILARREKSGKMVGGSDWTESDRKNNTTQWKTACQINLLSGNSSAYVNSEQRAAFYRWFYIATTTNPDPAKRSETRWPLAAAVVAEGVWTMIDLEYTEDFATALGITSEEAQTMLRRGNQVIFDTVFPKLKDLWNNPKKGQDAVNWDAQTLAEEQSLIAPLYKTVSAGALKILQGMSTGAYASAKAGALAYGSFSGATADNISGGKVPFFSGDLTKLEDRFKYGMKLADTFSTIKPGAGITVPSAPPKVDSKFTDGTALASVDWKQNMAAFESATDNRLITPGEKAAATSALKSFSAREQKVFIDEWDRFKPMCKRTGISGLDLLAAMSTWTADLPGQIRAIDDLGGFTWKVNVDYSRGTHDLQPMVLAAPKAGRDKVRGTYFKDIFLAACNDSTIVTATKDLGMSAADAKDWIGTELAD